MVTDDPIQLTLTANLADLPLAERSTPDDFALRGTEDRDIQVLADLYFSAYPSEIVADEAAALEEIEVTFKGEYGELDAAASPLIATGNRVVAAVLTVKQAPWDNTPPGPFLIEVIVHPDYRRQGLARVAILEAASTLLSQGHQTVALRVMSDNDAAMKLYGSLGFRQWKQ